MQGEQNNNFQTWSAFLNGCLHLTRHNFVSGIIMRLLQSKIFLLKSNSLLLVFEVDFLNSSVNFANCNNALQNLFRKLTQTVIRIITILLIIFIIIFLLSIFLVSDRYFGNTSL